jgi:hypothetical protein
LRLRYGLRHGVIDWGRNLCLHSRRGCWCGLAG